MKRKRPSKEHPCLGTRKYCACMKIFVYTNIAKLRKHQSKCPSHKELYKCSKCNIIGFQDAEELMEHWGTDGHYYLESRDDNQINGACDEDVHEQEDHFEIEEGEI